MIGTLLIAIFFPAIVSSVILWPPCVILRYAVLRRHGEGERYRRFRTRTQVVMAVAALLSYALFIVGLFFREVFPAWTEFLASGNLAMVVLPALLLGALVGGVLNKDRALRAHQKKSGQASG